MAPKVAAKPAAKPAAKAAASAAKPAAKAVAAPVKAAAPAGAANGLYVKGLKNESVADVKALFPGVTDVRLRRNKFALVWFDTPASAKKAQETFNGKEFNGATLSLVAAKASPKPKSYAASATVFVSPVFRASTTRKAVREQFAGVGKVKKLKMYRKNFAFVTFAAPAEAQKAVKEINGKAFQGKTLIVKAAVHKA